MKFSGSFLDLELESLRPINIVQCDSGLIRQHAEHVAVHFGEGAVERIHIGVDVADNLVLRDEWGDDSVQSADTVTRRQDQLHGPRETCLGEVRVN